MNIEQAEEWYVLRAKYNRALIAQKMLSERSIESFVPMEMRSVVCKGKRQIRKLVPILLNLIFVKTTLARIKELQIECNYLYYVTHEQDGVKSAMVIPEEQMASFRSFVEGNLESIEYIDINAINPKAGQRVRVTQGSFAGKEGVFVKVKGKRSRQVVVAIDGLIAVALTSIDINMIELCVE